MDKEIILQKSKYLYNNFGSIKRMNRLSLGSSMESHISHNIANYFSSRPKGFSINNIEQYIKINDLKLNNINIFQLYLKTYQNKEKATI